MDGRAPPRVIASKRIELTAANRPNRAVTISNAGGSSLGDPGYGLERCMIGVMFANTMVV
jgi:hypothetical protein